MSNTGELKNIRLDGIYPQRQEGFYMQRALAEINPRDSTSTGEPAPDWG